MRGAAHSMCAAMSRSRADTLSPPLPISSTTHPPPPFPPSASTYQISQPGCHCECRGCSKRRSRFLNPHNRRWHRPPYRDRRVGLRWDSAKCVSFWQQQCCCQQFRIQCRGITSGVAPRPPHVKQTVFSVRKPIATTVAGAFRWSASVSHNNSQLLYTDKYDRGAVSLNAPALKDERPFLLQPL